MKAEPKLAFDRFVRRPLVWFVVCVVLFSVLIVVQFATIGDRSKEISEAIDLFSNILIGALVSFVFYFLVVHLPEKERRNRIRINFLDSYLSIKNGLIWQIVFASRKGGRTDLQSTSYQIELLMDVKEFRSAFHGGREADEGWYAFSNHMSSDSREFREILLLLSQLRMQVEYILLQDVFVDQELLDFFTRLKRHLVRLELTQAGDWEKRPMINFLYELLAGWNFIEGYRDFDFIEREASKVV